MLALATASLPGTHGVETELSPVYRRLVKMTIEGL
jgi:hypothetical protein